MTTKWPEIYADEVRRIHNIEDRWYTALKAIASQKHLERCQEKTRDLYTCECMSGRMPQEIVKAAIFVPEEKT